MNNKVNMFDEALTWVNLVLAVFALHYLIGIGYFWLVLFSNLCDFLAADLIIVDTWVVSIYLFPIGFLFSLCSM